MGYKQEVSMNQLIDQVKELIQEQPLLIGGIALALILIVVVIIIVRRNRKEKPKEIFHSELKEIIQTEDVNKIILCVKDGNTFDVNKLHDSGVKGIQVVGDKIKFYFDDDRTKKMYHQMKEWIEEK